MKRLRRMLTTLVLSLLTIYIGVVIGVYSIQDRLAFVPSRHLDYTPAEAGLLYEPVEFVAEDGVRLTAWFIEVPNARGTALFLHGNGGNIACCVGHARLLARHGFNTLLLDYRGYGRSEGQPSEQGLYRDAEAAWRYLTVTRTIPPSRIILYGQSLGGGVAIWLGQQHRPAAMILDSTFTSLVDVGVLQYPLLPVRLLSRNRFPSLERVGSIDAPFLLLHSRDDGLIPFEQSEALAAAIHAPKTLVALHGPHAAGLGADRKTYEAAVGAFLDALP